MKRILIVKTTSMGDVIHALPVLHDIRQHQPTALIDWMVEEPFADLVRANVLVNEVVVVNLRKWRKLGVFYTLSQWKSLKHRLADRQYDLVIDLQGLIKSAVLACAANGPRAGASFSCAREGVASFFYSKKAAWAPQLHAVERLRSLVGSLLGYQPSGPPVFYNTVPSELPVSNCDKPIWFLHATARDEKKWLVESWRALALRLSGFGYSIVLPWGSEAERAQAMLIATDIPSVSVLPKMSLAVLQKQLASASLVVGVDTGITHLSAAMYLPLVALFFATPAWRFAPRFNPWAISVGDVGCMPSVDDVFEASVRLLKG